MVFIYKLSLAVFLYVLSSFAVAQETQGLVELLSPIRSLRGDFVQTILDNKGKVVQRSEGKLALQRPGQFRWEVLRPIPQLIIANHSRLWIYDPDLQQVVIRPLSQAAGQTPAFLLTNIANALEKDFIVRDMAAPRFWQWFSLAPKNSDSMYKVIQLGFLNQDIKEMRMQDNLGHNTVIQFKRLQKNISLPASLFQFHPPRQVDVIDETH